MAEQTRSSKIWDFINKHFAILAVGAVALFLYFGGCGNRNGRGVTTSDTTHYTVQQPQPIVIMQPYQPQQQGNTVFPINIPAQYNASADITKLTEQYNRLLNEFLALRTYNDSIPLKDSAGNRVGVVNLKQQVSENILKSAQPSYQLNFPHTFTTITNTIYPSAKSKWFMGVGVESPISGESSVQVNLGLLFQNKKDNVLGISGTYDFGIKKPGVLIQFYKKISFKNPIKQIIPIIR